MKLLNILKIKKVLFMKKILGIDEAGRK